MRCIPVIVGPTAGGKTSLAVALAHALAERGTPAEVVTADAFQVYRGLDIGTAKPTEAEQAGIAHHLIDLVEPDARFTVHDWLRLADPLVTEMQARGAVPIVVGGTNLYVKAFLEGLFDGPEPDPALREAISTIPQPERRAELERVDPAAADRIHPADERRTVRALEVFRQTGTPITDLQQQWDRERSLREGVRLVGLDWEAGAINTRINARVRQMMEQGLLDELRTLAPALGQQASEALGYKQLLAHLRGEVSLADAVEKVKIETRRFAKNQRTWLRRLRATPGSVWLAGDQAIEGLVAQTLDALRDATGDAGGS